MPLTIVGPRGLPLCVKQTYSEIGQHFACLDSVFEFQYNPEPATHYPRSLTTGKKEPLNYRYSASSKRTVNVSHTQ
jgi:hypothetical protein